MTSRLGSSEGYILLDAILAVMMVAILSAAIAGGLSVAARRIVAFRGAVDEVIEARNEDALETLHASIP